jgi:phosphoadenosine phosphosulfate reductase
VVDQTPAEEAAVQRQLETLPALERIRWAARSYGDGLVLSTSFGAQAAVMLHLATQIVPSIPVVFVDTGYLFPETYRFADELTERLKLNLRVYRPSLSPAWLEARMGRLWENGLEGVEAYNRIAKVEPMRRALAELRASAWLAGLRRSQSRGRSELPVLSLQDGRAKVLPVIDWTDKDVHRYLTENNLPYHPLWEKGYVSIGDTHTSRPLSADLTPEQTRFFGLKRECGLHEPGAFI